MSMVVMMNSYSRERDNINTYFSLLREDHTGYNLDRAEMQNKLPELRASAEKLIKAIDTAEGK